MKWFAVRRYQGPLAWNLAFRTQSFDARDAAEACAQYVFANDPELQSHFERGIQFEVKEVLGGNSLSRSTMLVLVSVVMVPAFKSKLEREVPDCEHKDITTRAPVIAYHDGEYDTRKCPDCNELVNTPIQGNASHEKHIQIRDSRQDR